MGIAGDIALILVAALVGGVVAQRLGLDFEEFVEGMIKDIPVGRGGWPEDVAAAILYFASEEASFVSGQVLYVAGGPRD